MTLGAISCPPGVTRAWSLAVKSLKRSHGLDPSGELKWNKVSPSKSAFYLALVDLFFQTEGMSFRGLVVPNKATLRHAAFAQTHDGWYYKMYYLLLRPRLRASACTRVLIDTKDTCGSAKIRELQLYLQRNLREERERLAGIQLVGSKHVPCLQMADLFAGALAYSHRGLKTNAAKLAIVDRLKQRTGLTLQWSTAPGRTKFDIFVWEANAGDI